jgi:mannosyltransferase OCH1-like enzyme
MSNIIAKKNLLTKYNNNIVIAKRNNINKPIEYKTYDIPKLIHLCYSTKNIPEYIIPNWKKLNPEYEIILYDNSDCSKFLSEHFGQLYVDVFNFIKDGPIKADFFRACVLYKLGGVYADIDIEPIIPIKDFLSINANFLTCLTIKNYYLNPHFIISMPNHILLKMCIDDYLSYYKNKINYVYWVWSIVYFMTKNLDNIFEMNLSPNGIPIKRNEGLITDKYNNVYQFVSEIIPDGNLYNVYCTYQNKKILNNRYDGYDAKNHNFKDYKKNESSKKIFCLSNIKYKKFL